MVVFGSKRKNLKKIYLIPEKRVCFRRNHRPQAFGSSRGGADGVAVSVPVLGALGCGAQTDELRVGWGVVAR